MSNNVSSQPSTSGHDGNTKWQEFLRWFRIPQGLTLEGYAALFLLTAAQYCLYLLGTRVLTPDQAIRLIDQALLIFVIVVMALHHGDGGKPAGLGPWKPLP